MSSMCRLRKPFCWHLKCQRLSWCCTVVKQKAQLGHSLRYLDRSTASSPKNDLLFLLPAVREWPQTERGERGRDGGSKAGAHRFAIFSHDFSLLLLHKKRRILDYLWHSKAARVEDSLNTARTLQPTQLYNSHNHYQIYIWVSKNMVCGCSCCELQV